MKRCGWCRAAIAVTARRDAVFCSKSCRQAHWAARQTSPARAVICRPQLGATDRPLRLAYADPPYPHKAAYYRGHADFAGEVDHAALVSKLQAYDGWALSTSGAALPAVLAVCPPDVRVAVWVRAGRAGQLAHLVPSYEAVVFRGGRHVPGAGVADVFDQVRVGRRRTTLPTAVIGMKPPAYCRWVFELLGARPGDELDDLFPGSGIVAWCWAWYQGRDPSRDVVSDAAVVGDPDDASGRGLADTG